MEGVDRIWLPGEIEHYRIRERLKNGIPLAQIVVANLRQLAAELNLSDRLE
jgi:LDH2 family malate/lactate/ureidoglycolate dehydrogenase